MCSWQICNQTALAALHTVPISKILTAKTTGVVQPLNLTTLWKSVQPLTHSPYVHTHALYPSPWRHQCRVSPGHIAGTLISSHTNTSCIHLVIQRPVVTNTISNTILTYEPTARNKHYTILLIMNTCSNIYSLRSKQSCYRLHGWSIKYLWVYRVQEIVFINPGGQIEQTSCLTKNTNECQTGQS